jgi:hypothetical protein
LSTGARANFKAIFVDQSGSSLRLRRCIPDLLENGPCYRASILMHRLCSSLAILSIALAGCNQDPAHSQGSWRHFESGGMFQVMTPTATDNGEYFFITSKTGHGDIYKYSVHSNARIRVTFSDAYEGNPVVSKNGTRLFFSRELPKGTQIIAKDLDSGEESIVFSATNADFEPIRLVADDSMLLVRESARSTLGHGRFAKYFGVDLSSTHKKIDFGSYVVASNCGRMVLFIDRDKLFTLDLWTGKKVKLDVPFSALPVAISATGNQVLVGKIEANWSFDRQIFMVTPDLMPELIGEGHDAIFDQFGQNLLVVAGFENSITHFDLQEGVRRQIDVQPGQKSLLRPLGNHHALTTVAIGNRGQDYTVVKINIETGQESLVMHVESFDNSYSTKSMRDDRTAESTVETDSEPDSENE